jgi:general secretion pathway protein D
MKKIFLFVIAVLVLAACATQERFREARVDLQAGREEEGLARLQEELKHNPQDVELRNYYQAHKAIAVQRYLTLGDRARSAGKPDVAQAAYQRALRFDPQNAHGEAGVKAIAMDQRHAALLREAEQLAQAGDQAGAQKKLQAILAQNPANRDAQAALRTLEELAVKQHEAPKLNAALQKPITMEFRDAPLRSVFELISQRTGLNFVFDKEVPADAKATVFVRDTTIADVIHFVLVTNQLDKRVLNDNTILVYPNTPAKVRDYKDLVVRSFYLANADVKQTANMIRQLVKTRDLFVDEKLNLLVIRDTPEAVAMAEKLVANQDLSEPEVMLEVEVLEVGYNKLRQLGIQWPGSLGVGVVGADVVPGQLTGTEARNLNSGLVRLTVPDPLVQFNAKQQDGRTNVLANPRIRVKNREKAHIHIGDRVPVITTTAGATGFVSESVNYLDVGLKLEVQPQVYLDDDVGIKIGLEVSNIGSQVKTSSGTVAYTVGTRNANTTLRLRDGETQVLAGLISDEDRRNAASVPGLSKLPVLGRLFSSHDDTVDKSEVVLLITPHVIRNIERPGVKLEQFSSGTEAEVGGPPIALPSVGGPAIPPAISAPPRPGATAPLRPNPPAPKAQPESGGLPSNPVPSYSGSIPARPPAEGPKPQAE